MIQHIAKESSQSPSLYNPCGSLPCGETFFTVIMNKTLIILGIYVASLLIARVLTRKLYLPGGIFEYKEPSLFDMAMIFTPGLNSIWVFALVIVLAIENLYESKSIKEIAKRILGL